MKNYIASSAIIGRVKLGKNIYIGNNSVIGTQPQYVGFKKNKILSTKFKDLIIADNVVIMDLCHIHAGIKRNTKIGKERIISCIDSVRYKKDLNNVFSNTISMEFINNKFKNSYEQYNEVLKKCLEKEKDKLFVIACGPMGKVLIYNLIKFGYQCIDVGHGIGHALC